MKEIKVSVIIPIYNTAKYLKQCLESIANQTLREIEIICVDDGSTDNSYEIVKDFCNKDSRFIPIRQINCNAGVARNNGLRIAQGKYVSFLDSDDFFDIRMLEEAYNEAEKTHAQFVVYNSNQFDENTKKYIATPWSIRYNTLPSSKPFGRHQISNNIFKAFVGWAWDKLYNREWILNNNLWFQDQHTSEDMLFVFSALAIATKISYVEKNKILAHHRVNNKNSLSNTREKSWDCFYHALIALRLRLIKEGIYQELERDFINYALHFSLWNLNTISEPTYSHLLKELTTKWWKELGITDKKKQYFYNKSEYYNFVLLMNKKHAFFAKYYLDAKKIIKKLYSLFLR